MAGETSKLTQLRSWLGEAQTLLAGLVALVGLLTQLVPESVRQNWGFLPWLGLFVAVAAGVWLALGAYHAWTRPPVISLAEQAANISVHIRGPRPFEDGDILLGRLREVNELASLVRSLEFRWGYISGEAGAGKTSLIRAGLMGRMREIAPDWRVVYIPRTGSRPDREITERLTEVFSLPEPKLVTLTAKTDVPNTLVVCDQFEEFFLSGVDAAARLEVMSSFRTLWDYAKNSGRIRLLFSLRKEFVDDLLTLAERFDGLSIHEWRFSLSNLSTEVTEQVLEQIARSGELPLAPQLRTRLAADLSRDGKVRPVELQIVLTRMLEQNILELQDYAARGGAVGIISRFIKEAIEPQHRKIDEIDRRVGRHVLRLLCANNFSARRPVGLSRDELARHVFEQLARSEEGKTFSRQAVARSVGSVLANLIATKVVIEENEDSFNLAHDYLAAPIRDATADIETAEERANRLLSHYVSQSRTERGTALPFRTYRQIQRYATPEEKGRTDAKRLLERTRRRYLVSAAGGAIGLIAIVTAMLPFGWHLVAQSSTPGESMRLVTQELLVAETRGRGLRITDLRRPDAVPTEINPDGRVFWSPTGNMVIFSGSDGSVFVARRAKSFRPEKVLEGATWSPTSKYDDWIGFSEDGRIGFIALPNGSIHTIDAELELMEIASGVTLGRIFTAPQESGRRVPTVRVSPDGRYIAVVDASRELRVFSARQRGAPASRPIGKTVDFDAGFSPRPIFSRDGTLLSWVGEDQSSIFVHRIGALVRPVIAIRTSENQRGTVTNIAFSPNSDRLVAITGRNGFEWRVGDPTSTEPRFTRESLRFGLGVIPPRFSDRGDALMGTHRDGNIYIWEFARPNTAGRPVVSEQFDRSDDANQRGRFCHDGNSALVLGRNGMLYRVDYGPDQRSVDEVQMLPAGGAVFIRAADDDLIILLGRGYVAVGRCREGTLIVHRINEQLSQAYISRDRRSLVVLAPNRLHSLQQSFLLWGLPVVSRDWPALEDRNR